MSTVFDFEKFLVDRKFEKVGNVYTYASGLVVAEFLPETSRWIIGASIATLFPRSLRRSKRFYAIEIDAAKAYVGELLTETVDGKL